MAAPLTWRNVDAPDFRGSMDGFRIAGQAFDRGLGGLAQGLEKFDVARRTDAENAVLNASTAFSDPAALRAAIASGAVFAGVDRGLVGRQAIGALDARAGNLLQEATQTQALNTAQQLDPLRIVGAGLANDRSRQDLRFGDATFDTRVAQLGANLDSTRAGTASTRQNTEFAGQLQPYRVRTAATGAEGGEFDLANRREVDADTRAAATVLPFLDAAGDARGVNEFYQSDEFKRLSPGAQTIVRNRANAQYASQNISGPFAGLAPSGGSAPANTTRGTGAAQGVGGFDRAYQGAATPAPLTTMPIGAVLDHQSSMIRTQGNSPVGAYQINRATLADFAPRALGENWRDQPLTAENQDKIAKALWEARRGGNVRETWPTLPPREGGYANVSWEEVRGTIAQRESGTDAATLARELRANAANTANLGSRLEERQRQDRGGNRMMAGYTEAGESRELAPDVVTRMVKEVPELKAFAESGRLLQEINGVISRTAQNGNTPISPAQAALIVKDSLVSGTGLGRATNRLINGTPYSFDDEKIDRHVSNILGGQTFTDVTQAGRQDATQATLAAADATVEQLGVRLLQIRPNTLPATRERMQAEYDRAKALRDSIATRISSDGTNAPRFDRRDGAATGTTPVDESWMDRIPGQLPGQPVARIDEGREPTGVDPRLATSRMQTIQGATQRPVNPNTPAAAVLQQAVAPPPPQPIETRLSPPSSGTVVPARQARAATVPPGVSRIDAAVAEARAADARPLGVIAGSYGITRRRLEQALEETAR